MGLTKPRATQIYNLDYKQATRVVTTTNISLSGGTPNSVDGVTLSLKDRVLVTGQSTGSQNGIYYVSTLGSGSNGTWTRTGDANETGEIEAGMIIMVTEGSIYADTQWKLTTNDPITIGTTSLVFIQNFQGPIITSGTSNVQIPAPNANVTIGVNGTNNVAVFSSTGEFVTGVISATGNVTGNYILGNGALLTGVITSVANINNGTSNVTVVSSGGNVSVGVGGTGNIAVWSTIGEAITGRISATGNIYGNYIFGNGSQLTGISGGSGGISWTTQANTAPSSPTAGSFWYDSYAQVKYQYINDGTSNVWVDQSPPTSFSTITVSGTATMGNVGTTGNVTAGGLISATGNITGGNLSIGTGTATVGNIVNGNGNGVGNIGTSSTYFNTAFIKATSAQYADLAEMYVSDSHYSPGTVVEFGGNQEITASSSSHSVLVAGIISTDPSYLMNATQEGEFVLPVALTGRVPCQVVGEINKGDRLVASDIKGVATTLDRTLYEPGCIIGKALESYSADEVGTIEVAVGRF